MKRYVQIEQRARMRQDNGRYAMGINKQVFIDIDNKDLLKKLNDLNKDKVIELWGVKYDLRPQLLNRFESFRKSLSPGNMLMVDTNDNLYVVNDIQGLMYQVKEV